MDRGLHPNLLGGIYDGSALAAAPSDSSIPLNTDAIYPAALTSKSNPSAFASLDMSQAKPIFDKATAVNFSTAAENAANHVEPDYILGSDGQLRANPKKTTPSPDGKVNIQVESEQGGTAEAIKSASESQKASIREMIRYFQKNNPQAQVPLEWLWKLEQEPNTPVRTESPKPTSQPAPQTSFDDLPSGNGPSPGGSPGGYSPRGFSPGGGTRGGSPSGGLDYNPLRDRVPQLTDTGGLRPDIPRPIAGDLKLEGPPTISPQKIDEVLKSFGSPAQGLGQYIYDKGVETGINPAVALAFYVQESSAGTKGVAAHTLSWGNIKGEGPAGSYKGFRAYHDAKEGVDDWYRLIKNQYLAPRSQGGYGFETMSQVISKYAPGSDNNNERAYVANVKGMVEGWKSSVATA